MMYKYNKKQSQGLKTALECILILIVTTVLAYLSFVWGFNRGAYATGMTVGARVVNKLHVIDNDNRELPLQQSPASYAQSTVNPQEQF